MGIKQLKCRHCGYEWESKSDMIWVCCPSCLNKNKQNMEEKEKVYKETSVSDGDFSEV